MHRLLGSVQGIFYRVATRLMPLSKNAQEVHLFRIDFEPDAHNHIRGKKASPRFTLSIGNQGKADFMSMFVYAVNSRIQLSDE